MTHVHSRGETSGEQLNCVYSYIFGFSDWRSENEFELIVDNHDDHGITDHDIDVAIQTEKEFDVKMQDETNLDHVPPHWEDLVVDDPEKEQIIDFDELMALPSESEESFPCCSSPTELNHAVTRYFGGYF